MGRSRKHQRHLPANMRFKHGAYYLTVYEGGKQVWKPLGRDFATAMRKYADTLTTGEYTVRAALRKFLLTPRSANTDKNYRQWAKTLDAVFGHMNLDELKPVHVQRFIEASEHKTSANRQASLLSSVCSAALKWGWIERHPIRGISKAPEARRERYITDDELKAILGHCDARVAAIVRVGYLTALRKSDLLKLRWSDVKGDRLFVATQKTGTQLSFPASVLDGIERKGEFVFLSKTGRPWGSRNFDREWLKAVKKAGLDCIFHDLRRKRITDLAKSEGAETARLAAGHTDLSTTSRYFAPPVIEVQIRDTSLFSGAK